MKYLLTIYLSFISLNLTANSLNRNLLDAINITESSIITGDFNKPIDTIVQEYFTDNTQIVISTSNKKYLRIAQYIANKFKRESFQTYVLKQHSHKSDPIVVKVWSVNVNYTNCKPKDFKCRSAKNTLSSLDSKSDFNTQKYFKKIDSKNSIDAIDNYFNNDTSLTDDGVDGI
jgi:hypothetical protein